jgi:hypothetical protein
MAQIVVSYAKADAARARPIAQALAALGFNVVETRLSDPAPQTLPQIVLWSRAADAAPRLRRAAEPVIVARLDASEPPLIRGARSVNLQTWRGRPDHRGWRSLLSALSANSPRGPAEAAASASPAAAFVAANASEQTQSPDRGKSLILAGLVLKFVAIAGLGAGIVLALGL